MDVEEELLLGAGDVNEIAQSNATDEVQSNTVNLDEYIESKIKERLDAVFRDQNPVDNTTINWVAVDKAYVTPNFYIRNIDDREKLTGHSNFKKWRHMIDLDLKALGLLPFIMNECGSSVNVSPMRRVMMDAQALQYLKATVSKTVESRLSAGNIFTAFQAIELLKSTYGGGRMQDLVCLHNKFYHLRFKHGYDPIRFVSDFEQMISEYKDQGTTFSDEYTATIFVQKIEGIYDHKSPMFTFNSTLNSFPKEKITLEYVKERFLAFDHQKYVTSLGKRGNGENITSTLSGKENVFLKKGKIDPRPYLKKESVNVLSTNIQSKPTTSQHRSRPLLYTLEQRRKLSTMTPEEKKNVMCSKCGLYFHTKEVCKNPGRVCFVCGNAQHEARNCEFRKESEYTYIKKCNVFNTTELFLIDSAATHHITYDKNLLFNYVEFIEPRIVKTANRGLTTNSLGEGNLPVLVKFGKNKVVICLKHVQYVPNFDESIISVSSLNQQFKTTLTLNTKSGYLHCRKLRRNIAFIEMNNKMYLRGEIIDRSKLDNTPVSSLGTSCDRSKLAPDLYLLQELQLENGCNKNNSNEVISDVGKILSNIDPLKVKVYVILAMKFHVLKLDEIEIDVRNV